MKKETLEKAKELEKEIANVWVYKKRLLNLLQIARESGKHKTEPFSLHASSDGSVLCFISTREAKKTIKKTIKLSGKRIDELENKLKEL